MGIRVIRLHSPDIDIGVLPADPSDCAVLVQAMIGPDDAPGEESFDLLVVTPAALERLAPRWGRGLLVLKQFSWDEVRRHVDRLVAQCQERSWPDAARQLARWTDWEFDGYSSE